MYYVKPTGFVGKFDENKGVLELGFTSLAFEKSADIPTEVFRTFSSCCCDCGISKTYPQSYGSFNDVHILLGDNKFVINSAIRFNKLISVLSTCKYNYGIDVRFKICKTDLSMQIMELFGTSIVTSSMISKIVNTYSNVLVSSIKPDCNLEFIKFANGFKLNSKEFLNATKAPIKIKVF